MRQIAHLDFETASACDIRKAGASAYATDPTTRVWLFAWWLPGYVEPQLWTPDNDLPADLVEWVRSGGLVGAHNAGFEWLIWNVVLRRRFPELPVLPFSQMDCTMARAAALALPHDLEQLARVLGLPQRKDNEGHALMMRMAKPRKARKGEDASVLHWWDEPERIKRLGEYCLQDVRTEMAVDEKLPLLDGREWNIWQLDHTINQRGVRFDLDYVAKLRGAAEHAALSANARMRELTGGAVTGCMQHAAMAQWIASRGVQCTSVAKGEIEELRASTGDPVILEALEVRAEAAKTSTAKFTAIEHAAGEGERIRGLFQYSGANTRRWAGRMVQVQNLPRVDEDTEAPVIDILAGLVSSSPTGEEALARIGLFGPAMPWISKCIRSTIVAEPGKRLVGADYSNIEGRYNAWQAGEAWKLEAFRAFDAKLGHDLYKVTFGKAFNTPVEQVSSAQRQVGKVMELSMGYQGSVGAFLKMNGDPDRILPIIYENTPEDTWRATHAKYASEPFKHELTADQWTAVKCMVGSWRKANSATTQSWWDLQDAAIEAVANPGTVVPVCEGRVRYLCANGFLWYALPNGSTRGYFRPRLREVTERVLVWPDGRAEPADDMLPLDLDIAQLQGAELHEKRPRRAVLFEGRDSVTKQWVQKYLYGGLQCENCVQSGAREILVEGMFNVEAAGFPVVLHVHDELVAEVPLDFGSMKQFEALMARVPAGFEGLPLAAAAWEGPRFG